MRLINILMAFAIAGASGTAGAEAMQGTELRFQEKETGLDFSTTRILITRDYIRIDEGQDDDGFVLYDRGAKQIYNVVHDDHTILEIGKSEIKLKEPAKFTHREERLGIDDGPKVGGKSVQVYRFFTNDQMCFEVAAVAGMLPTVTQAMVEFRQTLAGQQAIVSAVTPADLQNGCDLANNVFLPGRHLKKGFPVHQRDMNGRVRELQSVRERNDLDPSLFKLPDYPKYSPPGAGS